MAEDNLITIPDASALPDEGTPPSHVKKLNNLAGDDELTKKVAAWAYEHMQHFKDQSARTKYCDTEGIMDVADRMYRCALRRKSSSAQHEDTLSDVASTMFYDQMRTITANETSIFFNGRDLPAVIEPEASSQDYSPDAGKWIAEQQMLLAEHTFDEDDRVPKCKEIARLNNKYGNYLLSIEWDRQVEEREERVPTKFSEDDNKTPVGFNFKKMERVVKDCPSLSLHDIKDWYFDAQITTRPIDDMRSQRCIIGMQQRGYEELLDWHRQGLIKNLNKVTLAHLYAGEDDDSQVMQDRMTNAGEDGMTEENGLLQVCQVWGYMPIKEFTRTGSRTGRGKWDDKGTVPTIYWATFVGKLNQKPVCIRLVKNPNNHGRYPFLLLHSLPDDKGAFHTGFAAMLEPLYWQATTNINQAFDNLKLITRAPWVVDGPVHTRDLKFRANKLIHTARGVQIKQIDVQNTTAITIPMAQMIRDDCNRTTGADKPILGEALGGRASATEAKQVLDQSLLPLDAKASYVAEQLFTWMFRMDAELWRQYGDPKRIIVVTKNNLLMRVEPAKLWGPFKVRVTCTSRFKDSVIQRQELNNFIARGYPLAREVMGMDGAKVFWRFVFKLMGFERVDEMVPATGDFDAHNVAMHEVYSMLQAGQWMEPRMEQNQVAHLAVEQPLLAEYKLLPPEDVDPARLRMLEQHIQIEENMRDQKAGQGVQGAAAMLPEQAGPQGLPGELVGNMEEAQAGAAQNV